MAGSGGDRQGGGGLGNVNSVGGARGQVAGNQKTYSDSLKTNIRYDQRLKRNVLEITLEKASADADDEVSEEAIERVFKTLGIDIVTQIEGSQVHYRGMTSPISVWMKAGVDLEKFCKDISIKVTNGVMTGMIRPAGKKDVTVTIAGLDFNTPDTFVMDYLNKFGVVLDNTVMYTRFESGPFKGKYNGERRYQVDFTGSHRQMGTYHLIDGCKVRVYYRGNRKTCGRCHRLAEDCPGDAIAKNCALGGGPRVLLSEHMKELWKEIGFTPISFEFDVSDRAEDGNMQSFQDAARIRETHFPALIRRPEHSKRDIEEVAGITVKNFRKGLEDDQIFEFLNSKGFPMDHSKENLTFKKGTVTTSVIIEGLKAPEALKLFNAIHFHESNQKFFEVPLFCKMLR